MQSGSEVLNFGTRPSYVIATALPPCRVEEILTVHIELEAAWTPETVRKIWRRQILYP
jgi:hypothetical protein